MIARKHLSKMAISNLFNGLMILFNSLLIYNYLMRFLKVNVLGFFMFQLDFYIQKNLSKVCVNPCTKIIVLFYTYPIANEFDSTKFLE